MLENPNHMRWLQQKVDDFIATPSGKLVAAVLLRDLLIEAAEPPRTDGPVLE